MLLPRFPGAHGRTGFSQVELLCALAVLALGALGLTRALIASMSLADATRQRATATEAARRTLEALQDADFAQVYAQYNTLSADDPGGTAPGATFEVDGLDPRADDEDGVVGEIVFPESGGQLREDADLPGLGMPHDLDGDGAIDAFDHSADYQLLPVLVRVSWRGDDGPMQVELRTILSER